MSKGTRDEQAGLIAVQKQGWVGGWICDKGFQIGRQWTSTSSGQEKDLIS